MAVETPQVIGLRGFSFSASDSDARVKAVRIGLRASLLAVRLRLKLSPAIGCVIDDFLSCKI
jgi:hypothetical protein